MLSPAQHVKPATVRMPDRQRRLSLLHAAAVVAIALLTVASYFVVDRMLRIQRDTAADIELSARGRMLSQHIANLSGQYALGAGDAGRELRRAVDEFASTERPVVAGDAAIRTFLSQARNFAALPPRDPRLRASAASIFAQADAALGASFDAPVAQRITRAQSESAHVRVLGLALAVTVLTILFADAFGVVRPAFRRAVVLARENGELARLATNDPLTGVLTENSLRQRGAIELQKAKRYHRPLSVLAIDPDRLAAIDAAYGGSDTVLKALINAVFDDTRSTDLVGRINAEKFGVLLPETDLADAKLLAERLRSHVSALAIPVGEAVVTCTVSIGVAAAEQDELFFLSIFERAGVALYEAQMRGRNRVFVDA